MFENGGTVNRRDFSDGGANTLKTAMYMHQTTYLFFSPPNSSKRTWGHFAFIENARNPTCFPD